MSPLADYSAEKKTSLVDWRPILKVSDIRWIDLQYGDTSHERAAVKAELGIEVVHVEGVDQTRDLDALAALIGACDLVISISNTTAHIAAAVGTPTWIMVPRGNGKLWYWFTESGPSPWYKGARLFHQNKPGDWKPVIEAAASELKRLKRKSH